MDRSWCRHDATGLRIAGLFDAPPASVSLLQGGRSRDKLLAIACVTRLPPALAGLPEHPA